MRPTTLTEEQVRARRSGIGGSDAAAVIGVDPYRTALDIYNQKLGLAEAVTPTAAMKRGIYLEPTAVELYCALTGRKVRRQPQRTHRGFPWMLGNVDRQIVKQQAPIGPGVLEVKCPGMWMFAKIKRERVLPVQYMVQTQHYLEVYGYEYGSFALFSSEWWEMIFFDIQRDRDFGAMLAEKEGIFWNNHVLRQSPPVVEKELNAELLAKLPKDDTPGEIILRNDPEWASAAETYLEAEQLEETAENLKEAAKDRIKELMGKHGGVEGAGLRVYFKEQGGRVTFDKKALAAAKPLDRERVFTLFAKAVEDGEIKKEDAILATSLAAKGDLDLAPFDKVGKPFETFRTYRVKVGIGD